MKICFLVPKIENCGPVNVVFNIIKVLSKHSNVSLMLVSLRGELNNYSGILQKYCVVDVVSLEKLSFFKKIEKLNSLAEDVDIIHSHGFYPDLFVSLVKKNNVKKISTVHCFLKDDYTKEYGRIKGVLASFVHQLILSANFNSVVGCSESVKSYLEKQSIRRIKNIVAVCNGVDSGVFHQLSSLEKAKVKEKLNIDKKATVYIYCGRLISRKRVPEMIKIFTEKLSGDDVILIVLGDGDEMNICKGVAKDSQNILFLGFVSNPVLYYQIADYVISNSSAEGYPMSIIEAMSCGCLAYLSAIAPHEELINKYPQRAFPLGEIDKMHSNNQEIDASSLSSHQMGDKYYEIYKRQ